MKFKNKPNTQHNIDGRVVWESRSVAVVGTIFIYQNLIPHVLVSRRGPNAEDFQGKMNLIAGYLDWNESGYEALVRETWEEVGFNLPKYLKKAEKIGETAILQNDLNQPWGVNTKIGENHQNISLRYGVAFQIGPDDKFPKLTTKYNEIEGECEDPMWLSLEDPNLESYEWAFNHDIVIEDYYNYLHNIK